MALVDQIIGVESGGNPNAKNPRSSASGLGQFVDATWLSMLAKHRPDLQGSREELLALKSDPQLSKEMTAAYAADNGQILQNAGLPVTPGNTYLAHFAGPQGATKVLQADPGAPVAAILGQAAVDANPFLRGMTAADLQAWAGKKMGAPAAPSSQPSAPAPTQIAAANVPAAPAVNLPAFAAPQQAQAAPLWASMPAEQQPPLLQPIKPHRPRVDISKLRASFQPRQLGGVFFSQG